MTNAGRAWLLRNLRTSREAQRESLPAFVPGPLRPAFAASAALAAAFLARKHGVPSDADAEVAHVLRPALD